MKKIPYYFILSLFILSFLNSCDKDDSPVQENPNSQEEPAEEVELPSNFTMSIEQGFDTATIVWSQPVGENNMNLSYDIYLDGTLLKSGLYATDYTLQDLSHTTEYQLEIAAVNSSGETRMAEQFQTLDPNNFTFLLESYQLNSNPLVSFEYDTENRLITITGDIDGGYYSKDYNFLYGINGLMEEKASTIESLEKVNYVYENDMLFFIRHTYSILDKYFRSDYTLLDENTYSLYTYYSSLVGGVFEDYYHITLERNTSGNITKYLRTNDATNKVENSFELTYENGNLKKVKDLLNSTTWEFEYDDKPSLLTFYGKLMPLKKGPFLLYLENGQTINRIYDFPELNIFQPKNNLTKVYVNGVLSFELEYTYNGFEYPSSITTNYGAVYTFEYIYH